MKTTVNIETMLENDQRKRLKDQTKRAELKLCAFLVEHNLAIKLMDHLTPLLKNIFPDSEIAKNITGGRTKAKGVILNILREISHAEIIQDMKKYPFSLIIDETTDISTKKSLAVVVRYCKNGVVHDKFLTLIEVQSCTASDLFAAIKKELDDNQVPYKNIIGFAADHASVMMGQYNGVRAKLMELNKNIFVLGCVCHSFHSCASKASENLPNQIEEFVKDINNYFSNSSKRIHSFEEFQDFAAVSRHKMIKLVCTRWLSLESAINRILEQWQALKLFFTAESMNGSSTLKAQLILEGLNDPKYKIYLLFLSYVLKFINEMNIEFQSEKPKLYYLLSRMKELYKILLKSFIKKSVIDKAVSIEKVNVSNPINYIPLEEIYFGAKAANVIATSNIHKNDLHNIRLNILRYYIDLCTEITNRFPFGNPVLNFVTNFNPVTIKEGNPANSISQAEIYFPTLVSDIEQLDYEWRMLVEIESLKSYDNENFWSKVCNLKNNLNQIMFPHMNILINGILSLPHSSATAERIFSQLTLIKTKTRNRLFIITCDALLSSKEILKGTSCYKWNPDDKYLTKKWKKNSQENEDLEAALEDDVVFYLPAA
ncbi:unnamed protein product [Brassicogethes aeneus]|uniref:Zinc finger MYM-type protein 1-like n=1 Tax=Brassicogethes aeneus TaxID=1431903 RepID=A0A9P0FFN8_BRAAE|nr:unnamed protein product [Brassicogethes aeneus]